MSDEAPEGSVTRYPYAVQLMFAIIRWLHGDTFTGWPDILRVLGGIAFPKAMLFCYWDPYRVLRIRRVLGSISVNKIQSKPTPKKP